MIIMLTVIFALLMIYMLYLYFRGRNYRVSSRRTYSSSYSGKGDAYRERLDDPRWRRKRSRIVERDHYTCQWCGSHENLQVHHKYYMRYPDGKLADPWDYPDEKLITLCENCHRKWHEKHKANVYYRKWGVHYE